MKHALAACLFLAFQISTVHAELKPDIEYARPDGTPLLLDANIPSGAGPFPVVIVVHGGGWDSGNKSADPAPLLKALTDAGDFTWFSIDYRLAPKNRWPACFDDLHSAIRFAKAHAAEYKGDPNRIALMGYSAGGQLVCLAATMSAEKNDTETNVQAIVGVSPPTDFEQDLPARGGLSKSLQDLLDRPKEVTDESRQLLKSLSPINHIPSNGHHLPLFLLIQGSADKTVPIAQTMAFKAKLDAAGVPCKMITVEGAPHRLSEWTNVDANYGSKIVEWLRGTLAGGASRGASTLPAK